MHLDESELVELAFYAGWVQAFGMALDVDELRTMRESLKDSVADIVQEYLESVKEDEGDDVQD